MERRGIKYILKDCFYGWFDVLTKLESERKLKIVKGIFWFELIEGLSRMWFRGKGGKVMGKTILFKVAITNAIIE